MEFKHSMSLLFSNMGYIFKVFLWVLICMLFVAAIGTAVIIPIGNNFANDPQVEQAYTSIGDDIAAFANGDASIKTTVEALKNDVVSLMDAVTSDKGTFVGLVFALIFLYLLYSFLIGLSFYPMSDIVNKLMSSNLRFGYASSMALNFKNACKFSAAKMLITIPIDLAIFLLIFGLGVGFYSLIKIFALPIVLLAALLLCTLRATLFSGWLPRLLFNPDEKIYVAFSRSLMSVKVNFKGMFKCFFITFFFSYALIAGLGIPTFGLMAIAIPATYYFLLRSIELVGYYKTNGLCFYTDATTVIDTVEFGYRSNNQK